jgi:two-component sensor histidine kinase
MIIHELATNATKYGALSCGEGILRVSWHLDGRMLSLVWQERNGPPVVVAPSRQGFGSRLSKNTVVGQLSGSIDYDWQPSGLSVSMRVPLS